MEDGFTAICQYSVDKTSLNRGILNISLATNKGSNYSNGKSTEDIQTYPF